MKRLFDAVEVCALVAIAVGAGLIAVPAGFIVGGVLAYAHVNLAAAVAASKASRGDG